MWTLFMNSPWPKTGISRSPIPCMTGTRHVLALSGGLSFIVLPVTNNEMEDRLQRIILNYGILNTFLQESHPRTTRPAELWGCRCIRQELVSVQTAGCCSQGKFCYKGTQHWGQTPRWDKGFVLCVKCSFRNFSTVLKIECRTRLDNISEIFL